MQSNMASRLLFLRVCSYDAPLWAPKTFVNVLLSSVVNLWPHFLFIDNHLTSGLVLARPSLNHSILFAERPVSWKYMHPLTSSFFRVDLPRTVCRSECLNVEKKAPFVNTFETSFLFSIENSTSWRPSRKKGCAFVTCLQLYCPLHVTELWYSRIARQKIYTDRITTPLIIGKILILYKW